MSRVLPLVFLPGICGGYGARCSVDNGLCEMVLLALGPLLDGEQVYSYFNAVKKRWVRFLWYEQA
jgi:hypothetical protein